MRCEIIRRCDRLINGKSTMELTIKIETYNEGAKLVLGLADIVQGNREKE